MQRRSVADLIKDRLSQKNQDIARRWESTYMAQRPNDAALTQREQVAAINHFWRVQLGGLPVSTVEERECLVNDDALTEWLENFSEILVPTIIKHDLPRL